MKTPAQPGRLRTAADGCRRYLPVAMSFDSRAHVLDLDIGDDWDEAVRDQWHDNKGIMREALMHEYGVLNNNRKIVDFTAMGSAPWSVIGPHNEAVNDVRRAFTAGSYYSSVLGAAGLGERILNDLVLRLRADFPDHPETPRVSNKNSFDDWKVMERALGGWGVLDDETAKSCQKFAKLRKCVVHYRSDRNLDARTSALEAMGYLGVLISHIFSPHGSPPRYIAGTTGHSFLALAAENEPVVRHYFIPAAVLVSPDFEFVDNLSSVWMKATMARYTGLKVSQMRNSLSGTVRRPRRVALAALPITRVHPSSPCRR